MPAERRTAEEIRRDIEAERTQLAGAVADLRTRIEAKRRPAALLGGALAAALAAMGALKVVRRVNRP